MKNFETGLVEREILQVETGGMFGMVFNGAANGKSVVVQGVDLNGGSVIVNIHYEDVRVSFQGGHSGYIPDTKFGGLGNMSRHENLLQFC